MSAIHARPADEPVLQAINFLSSAKRTAAAWTAALLADLVGTKPQGRFGILMYHRVTNIVTGLPRPTWNVPPRQFRLQLSGLLRRGFKAWPLRRVLEYAKLQRPIPAGVFVVTFDDGYANFYTDAFPILRDLRIPATNFLATSFLGTDTPLPFDDWAAKGDERAPASSWRAMTNEQCRELLASGLIELGAHTHTHQDFRGRPATFAADLTECLSYLRDNFGLTDATFAFPFGTKRLGFAGGELTAAAKSTGVLCSLTTESELASAADDPFDWGRITAEESDTAATLAGKLVGWYGQLRSSLSRIKKAISFSPSPSVSRTKG